MNISNALVLDFGSQVTKLIARKIRELNVYSEIIPFNTNIDEIIKRNPDCIILSGSPASVHDRKAPKIDSQIFEKLDENIFIAGCYNGSGIGVGTLFGEQIAIMASNQQSEEISIIEERKKPNWLPPQPFLNIGIYSRLAYERIKARSEI